VQVSQHSRDGKHVNAVIPLLLHRCARGANRPVRSRQERSFGLSFDVTERSMITPSRARLPQRARLVGHLCWSAGWLGRSATSTKSEFRRDVVRLILLYRQSGYMRAVVDTSVRRASRDVYITSGFTKASRFASCARRRGWTAFSTSQKLSTTCRSRSAIRSFGFLLQASADTIVARLRNGGYPYAEVLRNFDSEAGVLRAEVELDVQPGPSLRIGAVMIRGLRDVDTGTVRRVMSCAGQRIKQDLLYQTQPISTAWVSSLGERRARRLGRAAGTRAGRFRSRVLVQSWRGRVINSVSRSYGSVECFGCRAAGRRTTFSAARVRWTCPDGDRSWAASPRDRPD